MDWSSVMTELLLPYRVAKTAWGGWSYLFIGKHLALNRWLGRKRLLSILVRHGRAAVPRLLKLGVGAAMSRVLGLDSGNGSTDLLAWVCRTVLLGLQTPQGLQAHAVGSADLVEKNDEKKYY
jgi:hypothetical protein